MKEIKYGTILLLVFLGSCCLTVLFLDPVKSTMIIDYLIENLPLNKIMFNTLGMAIFITLKNIIACAFVAFLSCWIYGIPIFMFIIVNAVTIGAVFSQAGISLSTLSYIFPHCIFELTAILIALGLGWRIWRSEEKTSRKDVLIFLKTVVPLLVIGAIVETYVTPMVIALK